MSRVIDPKILEAKSDQMNAVDFVHPMVFRVSSVDYFPDRKEQPIHINLEGREGRPFKPCKSMLRGLTADAAWTLDPDAWAGKLIELYCDPDVLWGGKAAGGIRISGISGIKKEHKFIVRLNRSQQMLHTFKVIPDDTEVKREFILAHSISEINDAKTNEAITALIASIKREFGEDAMIQLKDAAIAARAKLAALAQKRKEQEAE